MSNSFQIDGTDGSAIWRGKELIWIGKDGERKIEPVVGGKMPSFMASSWTELLDAIDKGRSPHHSGRDNLRTVALLEGAYQSGAENCAVEIDIGKI